MEIEEHRIKDMKVDKTVRIRVGINQFPIGLGGQIPHVLMP